MKPVNLCLVNAPTAAEFAGDLEIHSDVVRRITLEPQLGILSLAAVLEVRGDFPEIVDLNRIYFHLADSTGRATLDDFAEVAASAAAAKNAEVFGFTSSCSSYPLTIRIAKALKAIRPDCAVLFGGPQASVVDLQTLAAFPFVDFILRGEAEESLPWLLDEFAGRGRMERVPGLTYRTQGQPRRNPNAPVIRDLDALPSPAYHLTRELEGAPRAALEMGRGCPFACTFCSTNDFFRRNFRLRSPELILRDMRTLAAAYGLSDFDLIHDMFTVDRRRVVAFCEAMIAAGEKFTWSCSARTDCVDEPLLELMAHAGCRGLFFGIETGSARMQTTIDKHLDPTRAREILDAAERLGIGTTVSLIIGFPEETSADLSQTVSMLMHSARCPHSEPQINLLAPLAATPLHWQYQNQLTLETLCSDVSHQGEQQSAKDVLLIRKYPEIFPNFYLLPTPNLDRNLLLELREFALMGVEQFRWLLVALDRATTGMLDLFSEWRQRRLDLWPDLLGFEIRRYYRSQTFRTDFLHFACEHPAGKNPVVQTFLEYEDAMRQGASSGSAATPNGIPLAPGSELWWNDIPVRIHGSRVIELPCDIQGAVEVLRQRGEPDPVRGSYFYVAREVADGSESLDMISDWVASALRVCDGTRSMEQVLQQLADEIPGIDEDVRDYALIRLLEGIHADGLIEIFRPALGYSFSHQD
ncbi:MAG TPA: radical SAM protein [Candidatus Binatia bacterium]